MEKSKTSRRNLWSVQVPDHLDRQLERYIGLDAYQTKSEFIRVAVRDRLRVEMERFEAEAETQREAERAIPP